MEYTKKVGVTFIGDNEEVVNQAAREFFDKIKGESVKIKSEEGKIYTVQPIIMSTTNCQVTFILN